MSSDDRGNLFDRLYRSAGADLDSETPTRKALGAAKRTGIRAGFAAAVAFVFSAPPVFGTYVVTQSLSESLSVGTGFFIFVWPLLFASVPTDWLPSDAD